jgi:hypothetical protein
MIFHAIFMIKTGYEFDNISERVIVMWHCVDLWVFVDKFEKESKYIS